MGRYQTLTVSSAAFYQNHACKKKKKKKRGNVNEGLAD